VLQGLVHLLIPLQTKRLQTGSQPLTSIIAGRAVE
jgi:hypothetical protein